MASAAAAAAAATAPRGQRRAGPRSPTGTAGEAAASTVSGAARGGQGAASDGGAGGDGTALLQVVAPDTDVLLFLEAAGRASVHIENWLRRRADALHARSAATAELERTQQARVSDVVHAFRSDRPKLDAEIQALRREAADLRAGIVSDAAAFAADTAADRAAYMAELGEATWRVAELRNEARIANAWLQTEGPPARAQLQRLRDRLQAIALSVEERTRATDRAHAEVLRCMREGLVVRLRAVRDAAAADAAATDTGAAADEEAALLTGKPTTRTNERLTREVAVYVREALALEHSIAALQQQEAALSADLVAHQAASERLVLQNAASVKTRRILAAKLDELSGQLGQVERDAAARSNERADSQLATSEHQAAVVAELNDELDVEIERLLALKAELREAQALRLAQRRRARAASRFFVACGSDAEGGTAGGGAGAGAPGATASGEPVVLLLPAGSSAIAPGARLTSLGRVTGRREAAHILERLMA
jgi:hypothetical protein